MKIFTVIFTLLFCFTAADAQEKMNDFISKLMNKMTVDENELVTFEIFYTHPFHNLMRVTRHVKIRNVGNGVIVFQKTVERRVFPFFVARGRNALVNELIERVAL